MNCLNMAGGIDHSVDMTVLRDNWSATTLNFPSMCTVVHKKGGDLKLEEKMGKPNPNPFNYAGR